MQAFRKLPVKSVLAPGALISLQTTNPAVYAVDLVLRDFASDTKVRAGHSWCSGNRRLVDAFFLQKVGKTETNWASDGVKATVGTVSKACQDLQQSSAQKQLRSNCVLFNCRKPRKHLAQKRSLEVRHKSQPA